MKLYKEVFLFNFMKFKFLEHTADIKFQAFGKTIGEAFENSALAMVSAMGCKNVAGNKKRKVSVSGNDYENLLYNFLEEILILLDSEGLILSSVNVRVEGYDLEAEVICDDASKYNFSSGVKAVTYSEMFVKKVKGLWVCQVVLDV